ncbi:DUF2807 domain-containing protein [Apibacter raozihei]|uniref:head GIN domain-containing protein n=1 Tax=Apibacter TaxID=1778601 RepID=UPI0013E2FEE3|nr:MULTISPECIES: head GIN domain-containing protein [Apibacter]
MKRLVVIVLFFLGFLGMTAQEKKELDMGDFSIVKVFDRISADIIASDENKVVITGLKREDVDVVNKNGELKVRMKTTKLLAGDDVKVKIYYQGEISSAQASEGAVVKVVDKISSSSVFLNAKEGAMVSAEVETSKLEARVNSGGIINVSGHADEQDVVITSGGKYNGKDLDSENASVAINAGGNAMITATEKVNAKTRAGGVIDIYGKPEVSQQTLAGGKIIKH